MLQQHVRSSSSRLTAHGRQANDGGCRRRLIAKALRSFLPHLQMELETGSISRRLPPRLALYAAPPCRKPIWLATDDCKIVLFCTLPPFWAHIDAFCRDSVVFIYGWEYYL